MAKLDSRGLVDDGSSSLQVGGTLTITGPTTVSYAVNTTVTLANSGNVSVPTPGFYFVPASGASGESYFTGSVPAPGTYPGASLLFCETQGDFTWVLTGSAFAATKAVFIAPPTMISGVNTAVGGTRLVMGAGASISMVSDGYYWLINAGTGSMTFSGLNG